MLHYTYHNKTFKIISLCVNILLDLGLYHFQFSFQVKNKMPAAVQITAEQLLREAKERELELQQPVSINIMLIRNVFPSEMVPLSFVGMKIFTHN